MSQPPLLVVKNRIKKRMHLLFWVFILIGLLTVIPAPPVGLLCLLFFGGGYVLVLRRMKGQPVALTVEVDGIHITSPKVFLPWSEITGVGTWRFRGSEMVGFRLQNREAIWDQVVANGGSRALLKMNSVFGYDLFVSSGTTDPEAPQVAAAIQAELLRRAALQAQA